MEITLEMRNRSKKATTGLSKIAMIVARTIGTIILLAKYNIAIVANRPMAERDALTENGFLYSLSIVLTVRSLLVLIIEFLFMFISLG
jgi:hypothetical protein